MISNDAIHVQVEEGGEDNNVEGIGIPKINDCLFMVLFLLHISDHN
jgi:hypothetical protein